MLILSLVEIGPAALETFVNVFSLFHNYLPFEKSGALHMNILESSSSLDAS